MKIPAQQNGNPLAACYCSQLDKALSEVNYAKPLKRQFLSQMQDSLCNYLEAHPDARLEDLYAAFGTCLLYTSPSPRDISGSRMPSSA